VQRGELQGKEEAGLETELLPTALISGAKTAPVKAK